MILRQQNARQIAAIAQALVDGKQIQYRLKTNDSWSNIEGVNLEALYAWPGRFRVKPPAVKVITILGPTASYVFDSRHYTNVEEAAMSYCARNYINYQQHAKLNEFEV